MESGRADGRRFATKLRRLRDLYGKMTQKELHYASGVPLDLAQNYKQEKSLARGDAAERLAKALHVSSAAFYAVELDNRKCSTRPRRSALQPSSSSSLSTPTA